MRQTNIKKLILLCVTFSAPFILGSVLYLARDCISFNSTAKGEILTPRLAHEILPLSSEDFLGKWQLLYLYPMPCDELCQKNTVLLENLCIALGKDQGRVILRTLAFSTTELSSEKISEKMLPDSVIIIDPKGWLVMRYSASHFSNNSKAKGILEDLRRLMRYSYVG